MLKREGLDSKYQKKKHSILLSDEMVNSVFEYERDQLIIALVGIDLLIVRNWIPIKVIHERKLDNIDKYYFTKLPGFDAVTYPFIICSGFDHISLINIREM